jgi:hypothetical protein
MTKPTLKYDLLHDCLGHLAADLILVPDNYRRHEGMWALDGTQVEIARGTPVAATLDEARSLLVEAGYSVSEVPCNYAGDYRVTHLATAQALADARKATEAGTPIYLRFGRFPRGQQSTDHSSGRKEAGVSVYRGLLLPDGSYRLLDTTGAMTGQSAMIHDRPLYQVSGMEVGVGADGEPVLRGAKIVKTVRG